MAEQQSDAVEDKVTEETVETTETNDEMQDEIASKEAELAQSLEELNQRYVRLVADFDNYRRRPYSATPGGKRLAGRFSKYDVLPLQRLSLSSIVDFPEENAYNRRKYNGAIWQVGVLWLQKNRNNTEIPAFPC